MHSRAVRVAPQEPAAEQASFQTFTEFPLGDPAVNPSVAVAISFENREAVDVATDPDGNILEFGWMDPVAAERGPRETAGLRRMAARGR